MPKALPPATFSALKPWPLTVPYRFFDDSKGFRPDREARGFDLATAWWLMDTAFLAYAPAVVVSQTLADAGIQATVQAFSGQSTQCYVIGTDDWHVLTFRGTQVDDFWASIIDWATNFHIEPAPDKHGDTVHAGFNRALDEVWSDVVAHLRTELAQAPARRLWITGHSLGAALATLATSRCQDEAAKLELAACYTFGSPRVGDKAFRTRLPAPIYRVRNNSDVVTEVPPRLVLDHVGEGQLFDNNGHLQLGWNEDTDPFHQLVEFNRSLFARLHAQRHVPFARVPGPIADHAPINYATLLWNALEGG